MKIDIKNINDNLPEGNSILILGIGFDQRSLTLLKAIDIENLETIIGVHNGNWVSHSKNNVTEFSTICSDKGFVIGEGCPNATDVADALFEKLIPLKNSGIDYNYLIDATGFSHELLAIVIGLLNNNSLLEKVYILYTGAAEYSTTTPVSHKKWLSRGVIDVRSILGYPGEMLPSRKLHLVIMTGFEVERAAEVIVRYEPTSLSIGMGGKTQSVSSEHHAFNMQSHEEIINLVQSMRGNNFEISEFEFSCIDPLIAKNQILEHVSKYNEYNVVICPLNTKLATVGASLAAIENPKIQLCYSQPLEYNIEGYSKAGELATIIKIGTNSGKAS